MLCVDTQIEQAIRDNKLSQQIRMIGMKEWFCPDCYAGGILEKVPDKCPGCGSERTKEIRL